MVAALQSLSSLLCLEHSQMLAHRGFATCSGLGLELVPLSPATQICTSLGGWLPSFKHLLLIDLTAALPCLQPLHPWPGISPSFLVACVTPGLYRLVPVCVWIASPLEPRLPGGRVLGRSRCTAGHVAGLHTFLLSEGTVRACSKPSLAAC